MSGKACANDPFSILRRKGLPLKCNETCTKNSSKIDTITSLQDLGPQVLNLTQVLAYTNMLCLKQHPYPGGIIRWRILFLPY